MGEDVSNVICLTLPRLVPFLCACVRDSAFEHAIVEPAGSATSADPAYTNLYWMFSGKRIGRYSSLGQIQGRLGEQTSHRKRGLDDRVRNLLGYGSERSSGRRSRLVRVDHGCERVTRNPGQAKTAAHLTQFGRKRT